MDYYMFNYKYDTLIHLSGPNDTTLLKIVSKNIETIVGFSGLRKEIDFAIQCNPDDSEFIKTDKLIKGSKINGDTIVVYLLESVPEFIYQPIEKYVAHKLSLGQAIVYKNKNRINEIRIKQWENGGTIQNIFSGTMGAYFISPSNDTIWNDFFGYFD